MRTITRDIVSALIFSRDHKLFMGMKDARAGGVYIDCWHIPGGGVDDKEDKVSALKREIMEETGIDISPYTIKLIDSDGRGSSIKTLKDSGETVNCKMKFYVYKITIDDREALDIKVQLNDDLVRCEWVNLAELDKFKLTPPSIKLFNKMGLLKYKDFYAPNLHR